MNLSRRICECCREERLFKSWTCTHCHTSAVTHPAAFRSDMALNESKGVQASRKRGQAHLRANQRTH